MATYVALFNNEDLVEVTTTRIPTTAKSAINGTKATYRVEVVENVTEEPNRRFQACHAGSGFACSRRGSGRFVMVIISMNFNVSSARRFSQWFLVDTMGSA